MRESEIKEQIITRAKNIKYLQQIMAEIDNLPETEADKRADEYFFCEDKLLNTNCLDDSITWKRLMHEMASTKDIVSDEPNLYRDLIPVAIKELMKENYIYFIDNRYSTKDNVSTKKILTFLVNNYFYKQTKFGGYIQRNDFKLWIIDVLNSMNYCFSKKSIYSQIDNILSKQKI